MTVEPALATLRLVHLIRDDKITEPLRQQLFKTFPASLQTSNHPKRPVKGKGWKAVLDQTGHHVVAWYREPSKAGLLFADLLGCPSWCVSLWAGLIVAGLAHCGPVGRWLIRALALSMTVAVTYGEVGPGFIGSWRRRP